MAIFGGDRAVSQDSPVRGTLEHVVYDIDVRRQSPRRVWHARLAPDTAGDPAVNIFVGDWFPAALRNAQRIEVSGRNKKEFGYLEVETLTDLETKARFSSDTGKRRGRVQPTAGSASDVVDLRLGEGPPTGYTFTLKEGGRRHTVIMRGLRREGTLLDTGPGAITSVRVHAQTDSGGVLHAKKLEYLDAERASIGSLRVYGSPGVGSLIVLALFVLVLLAFAVGPWFTPLFNDVPNWVGVAWSAMCALILLGLVIQSLRLLRRAH